MFTIIFLFFYYLLKVFACFLQLTFRSTFSLIVTGKFFRQIYSRLQFLSTTQDPISSRHISYFIFYPFMLIIIININTVYYVIEMGRSCSQNRSAFKILRSTLVGKRHLGRPRRRCEDNIRMDLK
jgi:hypothetical protein